MTNHSKHYPFTIVIPTRERCDTFQHAIHTCVTQDYDDLEILVSDNFSQDGTREIVESFKDPRIRYLNTGQRLSMSDNYEFALAQVRPKGYVIYLGDDDGLLPNAIDDINALVAETETPVLRWSVATYDWPGFVVAERANTLCIPLDFGVRFCRSADAIHKVITFKAPYQILPVLYMYSAVAYDVIKRIKDASGRFYHSLNPDVYSGFAIAGAVDHFLDSRRPYAIGGASKHSIGFSSQSGSKSPEAAKTFFAENTIPFHSDLVDCKNLKLYAVEGFLQAKDHLPFFDAFTLDKLTLLDRIMHEATRKSEQSYREIEDAVLRMGEMHGLSEAARAVIRAHPHRGARWSPLDLAKKLGSLAWHMVKYPQSILCLHGDAFGVKNVYDASLLCHHILKLKEMKGLSCLATRRFELARIAHVMAYRRDKNKK